MNGKTMKQKVIRVSRKELEIREILRIVTRKLEEKAKERQDKEGKMMKVKFIVNGVRWFDKVNGNTYHSVRITRTNDGVVIVAPFQYGYADHYKQTALEMMLRHGWLPGNYNNKNVYLYERENGYPIQWNVKDGLKRDCVANGIL